jgi:ABC-2 type transport system ATP-binding protein
MANAGPAIEVNGLCKSFGSTVVLDGIDFIVERGAVFSLLGPNGAGKTTVINILTTLLDADDGVATVNGFDVAKQGAEVRESISLTGQFAAVDHLLTGRENLILIGGLRHIANPARTAEVLLEQFGLAEAADRRTSTYSGGMRRKLDIALGLVGDPSVIFLDEPTAGLDPESRNMTWETIRSLADAGKTILLTTQYLEEADRLADTIAILSHGRIAAEGTPQALKSVLPQGQIDLRFADATELAKAGVVLADRHPSRSESALTLTISTDGSVAQVNRLFSLLETA